MLHRRSTATALVAVLLPLGAALTSCGFDYPTDRVNTIAGGVNNRDGEVEVLGARVLASADGNGRLIGTLVYSDERATEPAVLTGVGAPGQAITPIQDLEVEIAPGEHTNLAAEDAEPIAVTGEFAAGDVITLTYTYEYDGETDTATLDVPVVKPCHQYAGITVEDSSDAAAEGEQAESEEDGEEAHEEEADATYQCDQQAIEHGEEEGGH